MLLQSGAPRTSQLIPGHRSTVAVSLFDRKVAGILKFAKVGTQTPVLLFQHLLQTTERHRVVLREQHAEREPNPVFEQSVEQLQIVETRNLLVSSWHVAPASQEMPAL